jgi:hypothetical protein
MCLRKGAVGVFVSLLIAGASWAQTNRGTITGIVTDPSGAVVPGVAINVTNTATGVANNVTTNESGVYTVPMLPAGIYKLSAEKTGFKKNEHSGILVQVGETVRLDFALTVGQETQIVEVTAAAPLLQRDTSDNGTVVTPQDVEDLPLTSFGDQRSPAFFMQLAPGVTGKGTSSGGPGANRTMTTQVSGSMVSSTTLQVDGADVPSFAEFEGDLRTLQIPPDAIQEFKLQSTNASAEFGRSGGGAAIFQVKSGTNQIHGSAFEYLRNDALNSRNFFQSKVSKYVNNEFGGTAGGPIKKDKAFIFGWYDGFRLSTGVSTGLATVPTVEMKNGDFTHYGTRDANGNFVMTPLYDPTTHTTCGPLICNNRIDPSHFDPVSAKVLPLFPNPSNPDPYQVISNYTNTVANHISINQYGLKGDYVVNEKNRLSVLYTYGNNSTPNTPLIPAPLGGGDQPSENKTRNARINYNWIVRSNLSNQVTLAWNQWASGVQPVSTWAGKSDWVSYLGLKGFSPNYPTQFPQIVINGLSYNGGGGAGSSNQHGTEVGDTLTWLKGKHTAKFGFAYMRGADNEHQTGRSAGYFNFLNQETGLPGDASTGIAFASFLLGRADEMQAYHYNVPSYARNSYYAAFVQDDFKVTRRLTLNLGLRWDLFIPDTHKYNDKSWVDLTVPNPGAGGLLGAMKFASASDPSGLNTYYKNFGPRVGLAYSLNDKTVIRAAYGIFYAMGNANRLDRGFFVQGYNGTVDLTSHDNGITPGFIWGSDTAPAFTPNLTATAFLGGGTPFHSAGTLILQDRTDSLPPYMENYTFGIQRQLPSQMVLNVAYVGNTGIHLASRLMPWNKLPLQYLNSLGNLFASDGTTPLLFASIADPNAQAVPAIQAMPVDPATGHHVPFVGFEGLYGGGATVGQALKPTPQYAGWHRYYEGVGVSTYNALQVKLEKRFSNGLSLLASYAWSKTLTDGGSIFSTFSTEFGTTTPWNRRAQKSYSFIDIPNNLSIAYVYELPVGKGRKFLNQGGPVNAILGGWKTAGVLSYQGGRPMNIEINGQTGGLEDQGWGSPDRVPGVPMATEAYRSGHFDPAKDVMFNSAAFRLPCRFCFGTLTPTEATVRDFAFPNEDLSLIKETKIREAMSVNFRVDFFNAFNRHVFGDNNGAYANEPVFAPGQPGFGAVYGVQNQPRTIQFGLNLKW